MKNINGLPLSIYTEWGGPNGYVVRDHSYMKRGRGVGTSADVVREVT